MIRHLILDRDGVLNVESLHGQYVLAPRQFVWIPGTLPALSRLRRAGVRLSVATNQSCVGRKLLTLAQLAQIHDHMLAGCNRVIEAVFVCHHAPDAKCGCRKPEPGLLRQAIAWSGMPAEETAFVGDALTDIQAARAAGVQGILVRTGKGRTAEAQVPAKTPVYDDVSAVAEALLLSRAG